VLSEVQIVSNDIYNTDFQIFCVGDQTIGFNWENGKYRQMEFKSTNYIVQKFSIPSPKDKIGDCGKTLIKKKEFINPRFFNFPKRKFVSTIGCWNIKEMTDEFYNFETIICKEFWSVDGDKHKLKQVICFDDTVTHINFRFSLNGNFHSSKINSSTEKKGKYKDSITISVGECTELK